LQDLTPFFPGVLITGGHDRRRGGLCSPRRLRPESKPKSVEVIMAPAKPVPDFNV
jgi:hypothetical protein